MLRRRWFVAAVCFTGAAVLFTGQVRADYWYIGRELSWPRAFAISLVEWELWTLLAPAVLTLASRFPVTRARLPIALSIHIPASLALGVVKSVAEGRLTMTILNGGRIVFGVNKLYTAVLAYWAIVAAAHDADQRRLTRERVLQASRLETELARAQVAALKMHLHPHFLFNTLNTISGLMREDVEAADLVLAQLSELLRLMLESEGRHEVPLAEEITWLRIYLQIQQTRFGARLQIDVDVPADCARAVVPPLVLQPIVENAIRHGFSMTPGPGRISIAATRAGPALHLEVTDEGPGVSEPVRDGHGLRNTRSRLRALHGDAASLTLTRGDGERGTACRITLPFRPEPPA